MADDPIRSQLPNNNYRKGWDETFGKNGGPLGDSAMCPYCKVVHEWCPRCRAYHGSEHPVIWDSANG